MFPVSYESAQRLAINYVFIGISKCNVINPRSINGRCIIKYNQDKIIGNPSITYTSFIEIVKYKDELLIHSVDY